MTPHPCWRLITGCRKERAPGTLGLSAGPGCASPGEPAACSAGSGPVASRPRSAASASSAGAAWAASFQHASSATFLSSLGMQQHDALDPLDSDGCHACDAHAPQTPGHAESLGCQCGVADAWSHGQITSQPQQ